MNELWKSVNFTATPLMSSSLGKKVVLKCHVQAFDRNQNPNGDDASLIQETGTVFYIWNLVRLLHSSMYFCGNTKLGKQYIAGRMVGRSPPVAQPRAGWNDA